MKTRDKIAYVLAGFLAVFSWAIAIYYWSKLPAVIPTHFNFAGQPDAFNSKSIFYVFLMPAIQTVFLGFFVFLYYKPQYSDIPTTMWLMTLEKDKREHAFGLIRTMLVVVTVWLGMLFTYVTYTLNASALNNKIGLFPWILLAMIAGLIAFLVYWTVKVYKVTKPLIKETKK